MNLVTYLDMVVRCRPASPPEQTVRKVEQLSGWCLSRKGPDSEPASNRRPGLGALIGIVAGVGIGGLYGLVRPRIGRLPLPVLGIGAGLATNFGTTEPMVLSGISDPSQ